MCHVENIAINSSAKPAGTLRLETTWLRASIPPNPINVYTRGGEFAGPSDPREPELKNVNTKSSYLWRHLKRPAVVC